MLLSQNIQRDQLFSSYMVDTFIVQSLQHFLPDLHFESINSYFIFLLTSRTCFCNREEQSFPSLPGDLPVAYDIPQLIITALPNVICRRISVKPSLAPIMESKYTTNLTFSYTPTGAETVDTFFYLQPLPGACKLLVLTYFQDELFLLHRMQSVLYYLHIVRQKFPYN